MYITDKNGTVVFILHPWPYYMTNWSLTILLLHLWSLTLITFYFFNYKESEILKKIFNKIDLKDIEAVNHHQQQFIEETHNLNNDVSVQVIIKAKKPSKLIRILISISWVLYNIAAITAVVVTASYFSYVYINDLQVEPTISYLIGNLHRHGFNTLVILIDIAIIAYPIRFLHFIYTLGFGFSYSIVTFSYWLLNKKDNIIYVTLDYNKPIMVILFLTILVFLTFLLQFSHYLIYRFKFYVKEKLYSNNNK